MTKPPAKPRRPGTPRRTLPTGGHPPAAEPTIGARKAARPGSEPTAEERNEAADRREETLQQRERILRTQEQGATARAALSALSDTQLREANERLVIATVHAQTMTEAAEQATAQMSYMAEHDVLTGLPNRALLADRLAQAIAFAQRHGKKVALMYLDLDHFKQINDTLGHQVGDQLLQAVAKRLQACIRHSDTVSRQGGDEFVVLLAELEAAGDAAVTAEKVMDAVAVPYLIDGNRLHITVSIGFSLYPDDAKEIEAVFKRADMAMYSAKSSGRNNYERFQPAMDARAVARQAVEEALRHGLEQRDFVVHYQPKVNLESGSITGVEALVRLRQADLQLLAPSEFIGIAEDSGLILPIGLWVLGEACRQMAAWLAAGLAIEQIAVNVSAVEFRSKGFIAGLQASLADSGLDPCRLELEMTESGLMQDTEQTTATLLALKELGVQVAIDDFGTGYSSLSYLRRFPIDTLKIDQSFVQDIDGEAIVSAVIAMGMSLKHRVVAEGIETPQQLALLQNHHCAEGQGFLFSRPLAADELASLLPSARH